MFKDLFILCMGVHGSCLPTREKRASDPITQDLWKSNQYSELMSHFFSPKEENLMLEICKWREGVCLSCHKSLHRHRQFLENLLQLEFKHLKLPMVLNSNI